MANPNPNGGGHDSDSTRKGLNYYEEPSEAGSAPEGMEQSTEQRVTKTRKTTRTETGTSGSGGSGGKRSEGLLSKLKRAMFGGSSAGGRGGNSLLSIFHRGGFTRAVAKLAQPKILAILLCASGIGSFSLFGIFNTYKNDDVIRNDPPLTCVQGEMELPGTGQAADDDVKERIAIMKAIFCDKFGYNENFLKGMLACMYVETGNANPDRLESDYILVSAKEAFEAAAGPGSGASSDAIKEAYWTYGQAFQSGGGWNGNDFYLVDGKMCCGIGLIQWTAGRALNLIEGVDKVSMDVSVMDLHYQCAFLLAEFKTSYQMCSPDNVASVNAACSSPEEATKFFFQNIVSGGSLNDVQKRLDQLPQVESDMQGVNANNEFTDDVVTMAEILADDSFTAAVAKSSNIQLCQNNTHIDTTDIAKAAVSISFLERGDYEDVHGAYGEYRRSARSPLVINDWDYVEGYDGRGTDEPKKNGTYGGTGPKQNLDYIEGGYGPGKQDLIACTEYYYYAHLIAFPKETGQSDAGYFSSCDRGTATAVRIAGADDKFPAGNPLWQLAWACGAVKDGQAMHNTDYRGNNGNGFLWDFAGFLRGCDFYSASGGNAISPGTVMISWSDDAANGYLPSSGGNASGSATDSADGNDSGVIVAGPAPDPDVYDPEAAVSGDEAKMKVSNQRWPWSISNTSRHIITFVGEGAVKNFWTEEWLYQQWGLFDDADRLIRGDLNVEVPEIMQKGMSFKSSLGGKAGNQKETFYKQQAEGAFDNNDVKDGVAGRQMEFNGKTGLPEFHAWEQIFVRLIHNSDDDAAAGLTEAKYELWDKFELDEDNYLDNAEDKIEQYQNTAVKAEGEGTYANKYFQEDWNSIGAGEFSDPHEDDYDTALPVSELLYYDNGSDEWTHVKDAPNIAYWRYELITDTEYRMNQFLRFGLASLMCSVASEEDADVVQAGDDMTNDSGQILGNLYRRYSRIPDEIDASGRFYYANTVMSNDMLQDLCQLYTNDRNGDSDSHGGGYESRNYGPMYLLGASGAKGYGYDAAMTAAGTYNVNWLDRRYGLTATDIENIMGGLGGMAMGVGKDDAMQKITDFVTKGLHEISDVELALYERTTMSEATTDGRKAHEGDHTFMTGDVYVSELYGINPFLMLESEDNLNYDQNPGVGEHSAERGGTTQGLRNSIEGTIGGKMGVDADNDKMDDRLAWIDRHYYVTKAGNIGTWSYMVASMNPSRGYRITSDYDNAIKGVTTLDATGTYGSGDSTNLLGSRGVVRYTDYIYAENGDDNLTKSYSMAERLFGNDDRYGDNDVRDDYNRREWMVVPYRHTHAQLCQHSHAELLKGHTVDDWPHIHGSSDVGPGYCNWWGNDAGCTDPDTEKIDTQSYLNDLSGSDYGDTCAFDSDIDNRDKYNIKENMVSTKVQYYARGFQYFQGSASGGTIVPATDWTKITLPVRQSCGHEGGMYPPGHKLCPGKSNFYSGLCTCPECVSPTHGHGENCPIPDCDRDCHHSHTCHELLEGAPWYDHQHTECNEGDDCHDKWGCNILEFLYHNNIAVYMAMPVVEDPLETMDVSKFKEEYTSGATCYPDKHNFLQLVTYNNNGGIKFSFEELVDGSIGSMANPNPNLTATNHMTGKNFFSLSDASGYAIGYDAGGKNGLMGYFTIEGNLIRERKGDTDAEEITDYTKNCGHEDLQRLESLKFRVGYGKNIGAQVVTKSHDTQNVGQIFFSTKSGLKTIQYSTIKPDANSNVPEYNGYGEVAVMGAQHFNNPTQSEGDYGGLSHADNGGKSGPDGSKGNGKLPFKSLAREILGDEHVAHVTFGSQDAAGLTDRSKDNGRDFMVYVDGKKLAKHFEGEGLDKETNPEYFEPSWYSEPDRDCPGGCGKKIVPKFGEDKDANQAAYDQSLAKELSPFVDMDADPKYLDPDTQLPTDKKYYDNAQHAVTDEEQNEFGRDNDLNAELRSKGTGQTPEGAQIIANAPSGSSHIDGGGKGCAGNGGDAHNTATDGEHTYTDNGDYRLWVTHASRGTRGMMTQYLNFKGFFHYVHSSSNNAKEFEYMLFTNVRRQDGFNFGSEDADGDGDTLEDFVYERSPDDAVIDSPNRVWGTGTEWIKDEDGNIIGIKPTHFSDTYGQGANSHWRNMIDVYNAAMSETRHFD